MKGQQFLKSFATVFISICLMLSMFSFASASEVTDRLRSTIETVIDIVKSEKFNGDEKARREAMRLAIDPQFHYEQMSMLSLAKNWNSRTLEEKEDFVRLFKKLLENSYASKLENYSDEQINFVDEVIKGKYALVKTEIVRKDGTMDVDYKLIREKSQWKVYDFVIEGVSMIKNYRSQFSRIIKKESFEGLKKKMNTKIKGIDGKELKG